jgi:hypothetical protein
LRWTSLVAQERWSGRSSSSAIVRP